MAYFSYEELEVWQRGTQVAVRVYEMLDGCRDFGLKDQMTRAAVSIPSNIAERRHRGTRKDFAQFIQIAYASGAELETQLIIAKRLRETKNLDYTNTGKLLLEVMKMLNVMLQKLKAIS